MIRLSYESLIMNAQKFVRSCPDSRTTVWSWTHKNSCVHVQTFVRSCPDFRAFDRLSCVHVQTFVRSRPDFRAFDRLSCVHVQTFVRFLMFPDYVILNARRPLVRSSSVWTYLLPSGTSTWVQLCIQVLSLLTIYSFKLPWLQLDSDRGFQRCLVGASLHFALPVEYLDPGHTKHVAIIRTNIIIANKQSPIDKKQ